MGNILMTDNQDNATSSVKNDEIKNSQEELWDKDSIAKKIVDVVKKYVDKDHKHKVTLSAELAQDLGMDSLSMMELLMELDEIMETDTDQEVAQNLKTVQNIIDYAVEQVKGKNISKL